MNCIICGSNVIQYLRAPGTSAAGWETYWHRYRTCGPKCASTTIPIPLEDLRMVEKPRVKIVDHYQMVEAIHYTKPNMLEYFRNEVMNVQEIE